MARSLARVTQVIVGAITLASVGLNIYLGYRDVQQRNVIDQLQVQNLQLQNAQLAAQAKPLLVQQHIIMSGRDFRALQSIDWRAKIFAGEPVGTLVDTDLSRAFVRAVAHADEFGLDNIMGTFVQVMDVSTVPALDVQLVDRAGARTPIGNLAPNAPKYLLLAYEIEQPFQSAAAPAASNFEYAYLAGGQRRSAAMPYEPPGARSWVPSLGGRRGMGSALAGGARNYLLPEAGH